MNVRKLIVCSVVAGAVVSLGVKSSATAQSGTLDPTFGGGAGYVTTPLNTGGRLRDLVVQQTTNKIVAIGSESNNGTIKEQWVIFRYNVDGSLDATFGTGGRIALLGNTTYTGQAAYDVALDSSERILVAGTARVGTNLAFTVIRLNAVDGSLDASFGSGGIVQTRIATKNGDYDYAYAVAFDPNSGKILVGGSTVGAKPNKSRRLAVARYDTSGVLDATFDGDGIMVDDVTTNDDTVREGLLVVQNDGRILVGGISFQFATDDWIMTRYNGNGSIDTSFGASGRVFGSFPGLRVPRMYGLALQSDGKVIASGRGGPPIGTGFNHVLVARYNTNGSLDTSFDGDGWNQTTNTVDNQGLGGCAIQADGRIIVGQGWATGGSNASDILVTRFTTGGALDATYDGTGQGQLVGVPGNTEWSEAVAIDANGDHVLGGFSEGGGVISFIVARYLQ